MSALLATGKALPTRWRTLYLCLALVVAFGLGAFSNVTAWASHPKTNRQHIWTSDYGSLSTTYARENGCTQSLETASITDSRWRTLVRATLKYDAPDVDWHGVAGGKINIFFVDVACSSMTGDTAASNRIRYYTGSRADVDAGCKFDVPADRACSRGFDCATDVYGHMACESYQTWIPYERVTGTAGQRRHVISHETGHFFGLLDPVDPDGDGINSPCTDNSVMHSKWYCGSGNHDREFPQPADKDTVTKISNGQLVPESGSTLPPVDDPVLPEDPPALPPGD
jgi:hypothetical protein